MSHAYTHTHTQSTDPNSLPSPTHTSSAGDLGLTGSAIKEEKKTTVKRGVTNVRGMLQNAIRDASADIGTGGPQVPCTTPGPIDHNNNN